MTSFLDDHRDVFGVEPICKVLPIAPSTYYRHAARQADPSLRSARAKRDESLSDQNRRIWDENFQAYGARKIGLQLQRQGTSVARCTVERWMRSKRNPIHQELTAKKSALSLVDQAKLTRLRKENAQLRMEHEIFKSGCLLCQSSRVKYDFIGEQQNENFLKTPPE